MDNETRDRLAYLARMAAKYVGQLAAEWPEATPFPDGVELPELTDLGGRFDALAWMLEDEGPAPVAPVPAPAPMPAPPPDPIAQEFDDWLNGSDS